MRTGHLSTGTGFFFKMDEEGDQHVPVIITNKHVVEGAFEGQLIFTKTDVAGNPILTDHYVVDIPAFQSKWIPHPDPEIDLCAMAIAPIINYARNTLGIELFITFLDEGLLPSLEQLNELDTVENIIMVGYPNGFADTTNNKPIFRKGITATSPKIDYLGKPQFLIDMAVFPGSSGSPVYIADSMGYSSKGNFYLKGRIFLIGVVFAVYQHGAAGKIIQVPINQVNLSIITGVPNHIGLVIKFDKILDLKPFFKIDRGRIP